jgi:ADP-heptose:LPS heptosyltransferase
MREIVLMATKRIGSFLLHGLIFLLGAMNRVMPFEESNTKRTLLVVRTDALGDSILFIPVLAELRNNYSNWWIVLVVQEWQLPVMRSCPYADEVIGIDIRKYRSSLLYALQIVRKISRLKSDTCINGAYSRGLVADEIALWSKARNVVGWKGAWQDIHAVFKPLYDRMYSVRLDQELPPQMHELARHTMLLQSVGIAVDELKPELWPAVHAADKTESEMLKDNRGSVRAVVFVTGAKHLIRKWPFERFVELAARVHDAHPEILMYLVGNDRDLTDSAGGKSAGLPKGVADLRGKTSLPELVDLLRQASLVVGNDTGPMHLAIGLGIPTVCVLGGGHFGRFMPYGESAKHKVVINRLDCFQCNWNCTRSRPECILDVSVDRVWEEVRGLLQNRVARSSSPS